MLFEFEDGTVYVQLRKTAQEAKDEAGTRSDQAFSWGRFYFAGSENQLARIKKVLF